MIPPFTPTKIHHFFGIRNSACPQFEAGGLQRAQLGFSLVEVVVALGIVSFAVIPLMGLLPMGMTAQRDAVHSTVSAQISQAVLSDLRQTPFSDIAATHQSILYFDNQGRRLQSSGDAARIYDVRLTVVPTPTLTGDSLANSVSDNLARVKIEIASNPGRNANPFGNAPQLSIHYGYVANNL